MAQEAQRLQAEATAISKAVASSFPVLRATSSLTQASFASASGVSQAYLSQVENGTRTSGLTVLRLAESLHRYSINPASDLSRARRENK